MSEFRHYDKDDRWTDPRFSPESGWQYEKEMDFPYVDLGPYATKTLQHLSQLLAVKSDKDVVDLSISILNKLTFDSHMGKEVVASAQNSSQGVRLVSPILEAAKTGCPNQEWLIKYEKERQALVKNGEKFRAVEFGNTDSPNYLDEISERTGVEDIHTIIDQAVRVTDWLFSEVVAGNTIYGMDQATGHASPYKGVFFTLNYPRNINTDVSKRISCLDFRLPTAA